MYAKVINDAVVAYPYTRAMFRTDNPNTSIGDATPINIAEFGVFLVETTLQPSYDPLIETVVEAAPALVAGVWTQQWSVVPLDPAVAAANQAYAAQQAADLVAQQAAKAESIVAYLVSHTAAEIKAKINTDVTDLASAKAMLGKFGVALAYLARQSLR